jgi:TetR/AcrR family transcriptional repressor of nem operon
MARPLQIDIDKALKSARVVLWRQGYTATSMSQLLDAMNIGSGSFYAAFGSKAELFKHVVDEYTEWSMDQFAKVRAHNQGLDAICLFLEKTLVDISSTGRQQGCLLVNSVLELKDVDQELYEYACDALKQLDSKFRECVDEAQSLGVLCGRVSEEDAVKLLSTQVQGMRVASRMGLSKTEARRRVSVLMDLLTAD